MKAPKRPRCQCLSPDGACGSIKHTGLLCMETAELEVQSRDFDEGVYQFCVLCAVEAKASRMFVGVGR